jgi:hypothetical protein
VYFPLQGPRFLLDSSQLLNTLPDLTVASHFEIKMEPQFCYIKKNIINIFYTKGVSRFIWDTPGIFIYNNFQNLYQKFSLQFIGHQCYLKNEKKKTVCKCCYYRLKSISFATLHFPPQGEWFYKWITVIWFYPFRNHNDISADCRLTCSLESL